MTKGSKIDTIKGSNEIDKLLAVIVLYNTSLENSTTIRSLINSLTLCNEYLEVYIYDNSPISQYNLEKWEYDRLSINYQSDSSNPGISKAYNMGAEFGKRHNKKWLLFLDQDTSLNVDFIPKLVLALKENENFNLFVPLLTLMNGKIFSPCRYFLKRGFYSKHVSFGPNSLKKLTPVNSGITISLDLFYKAGGYNEKVKLDFSDFQFIERVMRITDKFYVLESVALQDFSDDTPNFNQTKARFNLYCESASNCSKPSFIDSFEYLVSTFIRTFKLTLKWKSAYFLRTWYKLYVKNTN